MRSKWFVVFGSDEVCRPGMYFAGFFVLLSLGVLALTEVPTHLVAVPAWTPPFNVDRPMSAMLR